MAIFMASVYDVNMKIVIGPIFAGNSLKKAEKFCLELANKIKENESLDGDYSIECLDINSENPEVLVSHGL